MRSFSINSNSSEVSFTAAGPRGKNCFPQTRKGLPIKVGLFTELEQVCWKLYSHEEFSFRQNNGLPCKKPALNAIFVHILAKEKRTLIFRLKACISSAMTNIPWARFCQVQLKPGLTHCITPWLKLSVSWWIAINYLVLSAKFLKTWKSHWVEMNHRRKLIKPYSRGTGNCDCPSILHLHLVLLNKLNCVHPINT